MRAPTPEDLHISEENRQELAEENPRPASLKIKA
jgi:hypothetical protein